MHKDAMITTSTSAENVEGYFVQLAGNAIGVHPANVNAVMTQ